jgi:phospholipid/cholesterol/gamma-HCH transport system substrate-binding protein
MDKSRLEWKVGLFVCVGLALLAILLLQFTKGASFFRPHYDIRLRAISVSGLREHSQVLMSGVHIGTVQEIRLGADGKSVVMILRIYRPFQIRKDSHFVIAQADFLGDRYVAILPTSNEGPVFAPGEEARAEATFDLQDMARTASGLIQHIDAAATNVNTALNDVRRTILSAQALTNLTATLDTLHKVSDRSLILAENVNTLVASNRAAIDLSVSNLLQFSEKMNQSGSAVRDLLATNAPDIRAAVQNIESASATLKNLLAGVQQGKGLAGKLLENEEIAANLSQIVSNLNVTSSNLNRRGLWGILWEHKSPAPPAPRTRQPLTSPKNPFE